MKWIKDTFEVNDRKGLLTVDSIKPLFEQGEWCRDYSDDQIRRLIRNSFWLGLYSSATLIGFARMVTDKETVTLITDFIVDSKYRNRGLGSWLIRCLIQHPKLRRTSMSLGTQDADLFFNRFGFERLGSLMHRFVLPEHRPDVVPKVVGFPPKYELQPRREAGSDAGDQDTAHS